MRWTELLKFSAQSLWRRKLRTVLTLLGVMIGTASIVVMMSLGIGLNDSYIKQIEDSGTLTRITVNNYGGDMKFYGSGMAVSSEVSSSGQTLKLDKTAIDGFAALPHVTCTSPVYEFGVIAKSGKYEANLYVTAMTHEMLEAQKMPVIKGALPEKGAEFSFIAGSKSGYNFYDPNGGSGGFYYGEGEPTVDMYAAPVFVIFDQDAYYNAQGGNGQAPKKYLISTSAVVGTDSAEGWSDYDYSVYADLDSVNALFQKLFRKNAWPNQQSDSKGKPITPMVYNSAYVIVDSVDSVTEVQQMISDMGYQASSQLDYLKAMQEQSKTIQYVLAGIGSVSLIVAAIGITNTMLMSIFERTKEIGIFKVLGCSLGNIRSMFLCEAGIIGLCGGTLGLGLSFTLSVIINKLIGQISVIPLWLALLGIGFAVVVGIVAGLSPAIRATKLSPLEAIRSL